MKRLSFVWMAPALTAIGKRFGIDAHYFAKNTAAVTLSHTVSVLKGIITGYLVTRMFPPAMYGEYKFALSIIGVIGFIALPGLPIAVAGAIARKEPISVHNLAKWYGCISAIGSLILLGSMLLLPYWGKPDLWPMFLIGALLFSPGAVSTSLYGGIIRGTGEFTNGLRASFITNTLVAVAVFIMLMVRPSSLVLLALTSGIPAVVYLCFLIPYERRFRSKESQKPLIAKAFNLSIATIPVSLSWYIDSILISALFGLNQLALFSVALLIPEQLKIWTKEIIPVLFSRQASGSDSADRRRKMHQSVIIGTVFFALGIFCYILIAPFIIPVLFPKYPADELVRLTSVAALILITSPATLYPQFLEARGMMKGVHWSNWSASIAFVIALFALIPLWGPLGAIVARGIFRLTYVIAALIIIQRTPVESSES